MTKISNIILFYFFIAFIFVNKSNALEFYQQIPNMPNDTAYDCYITDIFDEGGEFYLKVRPIHFLSKLSAVIEAKKHGVADYIIDIESKDTTWYAPKDYSIDDRNKSEFKLVISDKVKVSIYVQEVFIEITFKELLKNPEYYKIQLYNINPITFEPEKKGEMDYYPYEIAVIKGEVTIIRQVYLP